MLNKKAAQTIGMLLVLVFMFAAAAVMPVFATDGEGGEPPLSGSARDGDGADGDGDGDDITKEPGQLTITGVEYNLGDKIYEGNWFTLYVHVFDTRVDSMDYQPKAMLNTGSFTGGFMSASGKRIENGGMSYVLAFDLTYTGKGNTFKCEIYYNGGNTTIPMQEYSLTFDQCVETEIDSSSDLSSSSSAIIVGTGFVLKSVNFGESEVKAGGSFDLDLELMTTSGTYGVNNVAVAINPSKEFTIAAGASNIYIGNLGPNKPFSVRVPLTASATVEEGSYDVDLTVSGVGAEDGSAVSSSIKITIPIVQPERFDFGNIQMPESITAGSDDGSGYGTVSLINKGKGVIANVSVDVIGDGVYSQDGSQFVGNISAGTEKSIDFTLMADNEGTIPAQIVVTYENAKGEEKEITHSFNLEVMPGFDPGGDFTEMPMPEPEPEKSGMPVWGWLLIGLGVVAGIVIAIVAVKKRNAKRAAALEDDQDEDF